MLTSIRRLFCRRCFSWGLSPDCGDHGTPVERWATKTAQLSTPDQIIAARIVDSFVKDLETSWTLHERARDRHTSSVLSSSGREEWYKKWTKPGSKTNYYICNRVLENGTIFVAYHLSNSHYDEPSMDSFHVNEVPISNADGRFIIKSFTELKSKIVAAKAAADRAKKEMEDNEARWNLVEKLFHMRRDEQGALVTIERWACEHGGLCSDEDCRPIREEDECLLTSV